MLDIALKAKNWKHEFQGVKFVQISINACSQFACGIRKTLSVKLYMNSNFCSKLNTPNYTPDCRVQICE